MLCYIKYMVKTIRINDNLHSQLGELGSKNETYEDVIQRLLDSYKKKK